MKKILLLSLMMGLFHLPAHAGFMADMHLSAKGKEKVPFLTPPKLYVEKTNFRMDFKTAEGSFSTISKQDGEKVVILVHDKKAFMSMDNQKSKDSSKSNQDLFNNDATKILEDQKKKGYDVKKVGMKKYNGQSCEEYQSIHPTNNDTTKICIGKDLGNYPVFMESEDKDGNIMTMQLKNIQKKKIASAQFSPPKGYSVMQNPTAGVSREKMQKMQTKMQAIMADPNLTQEQKQKKMQKMMQDMGIQKK